VAGRLTPGTAPPPHRPSAPPPEEDALQSRLEHGLEVHWHLVGGRPVRSLLAGTGGPELVVVPGLGALGYLVPLVRACAAWTRVHLLDLPGFGARSTARLPADLTAVSTALGAWLDAVPDAPVLLLGHSTGAQAALRAAHDRPERVRRLVLAGATFPPQARRPVPLLGRVLATLPSEQVGQVPAVLPYYARGRGRVVDLLRSAMADEPSPEGLHPPLVLRGRRDRLCPPAWARHLAAGGPVVELPGGHNAVWTHPGLASEALRRAAG
jgi:pimeloyl-ACP methyl ester carboxylesterase